MGNPSIKFSCFNSLLALIKEEQLKVYKAGRKGFTAAYIPFIAVFLIIIFFSNCNTTEPIEDNLQPGRRDYIWIVDTLHGQGYSFEGMWGSSPDDIWVCSPDGGATLYDFIQHFDGVKWTPFPEIVPVGDAYCIFGFSKDNVWLGGNDGTNWQELLLTKFGVQFLKIRNEGENVFLFGYNNYSPNGENSAFFYQYSEEGQANIFSLRQIFAKL